MVLAKIEGEAAFDAPALKAILKAGPETIIRADRNDNDFGPSADTPIEHGNRLPSFRISYQRPELLDLRLNGHLLAQSDTADGYRSWFADGWTQVQVNLPPEKAKGADLLVVTVLYRGKEKQRDLRLAPAATLGHFINFDQDQPAGAARA